MTTTTVDLTTAQRLAALGFPQTQWPQFTWSNPGYGSTIEDCDYWTLEHTTEFGRQLLHIIDPAMRHYAAPHPVDALEWAHDLLEERLDCTLSLEHKGGGVWQIYDTGVDRLLEGTRQCTAPELLTAVLDLLEVTA